MRDSFQRLLFGAVVALVSACGSGDDTSIATIPDEPPDASAGTSGAGGADGGPAGMGGSAGEMTQCTDQDLSGCAHYPDTSCIKSACVNGSCAEVPRADGEALPDSEQTTGDCQSLVCDGAGQAKPVPADDPGASTLECSAAGCSDGQPVEIPTADLKTCSLGVCSAGNCVKAFCVNGVKDQQETDVDCGGGECNLCPDDGACGIAADCQSGVCDSGVCQPPGCSDGVKNGSETDRDCGATCNPCADGSGCSVDGDCSSGVCNNGTCTPPSCSDGVKNGSESGPDCGGGVCNRCQNGSPCSGAGDCVSGVCGAGGTCEPASCTDGVQNGTETEKDCGGGCPGCAVGGGCIVHSDCASAWCNNGSCAVPSCSDGVRNGTELDVDCGGPCTPCALGQGCSVHADCTPNACFYGKCAYSYFSLRGPEGYEPIWPAMNHQVLADLDGDGALDSVRWYFDNVAVGGGQILIAHGDGKGSFSGAHLLLSAHIAGLVIGDANGDGWPDLLAEEGTHDTGNLRVYLNDQQGNLVLFSITPATYANPSPMRLADLDGDLDLDLVGLNDNLDVAVQFNDGVGSFAAPQTYPRGGGLLVFDVDTDLDADIATVGSKTNNNVFVYKNDGTGKFTEYSNFGTGGPSRDFAFGDLNHDGFLDLAYSGGASTRTALNDGNGYFPPWRTIDSLTGDPFMADIDLDGDVDLGLSGVTFLENVGNGTLVDSGIWLYGSGGLGARFVDVTGDCRRDLVYSARGHIGVTRSLGNGVYPNPPAVQRGSNGVAVDLDGDGDLDTVGVTDALMTVGLLQNGVPTFKSYGTNNRAKSVIAADLDADNDQDLVLLRGLGVWIWLNSGDGTFLTPTTVDVDAARVLVRDADGDAKVDILAADPAPWGGLFFVKGNGDGTFQTPVQAWAGSLSDIVTLHPTGGTPSLAGLASGVVAKFKNTGAGTFATPELLDATPGAEQLVTGNFDGDKQLDIAILYPGTVSSVVRVLTGIGYQPTPSWTRTVFNRAQGMAAGDLNGDGRSDLVVPQPAAASFAVMLNRGDSFDAPKAYLVGTPLATHAIIADMDSDGRLDVVADEHLYANNSSLAPVPCPACGDGSIADPENCDDGGVASGDGCSASCVTEAGYSCTGAPSACSAICGDGVLRAAEACDDHGKKNGDGCSSTCKVEVGWSCVGRPSKCEPICGDGIIRGSEICDDANTNDGDSCPSSCRHDLWSTNIGDTGVSRVGGGAMDSSGNIYLALTVSSSITVNGVEYPSLGGNDALLVKLNPQGLGLWAKRFGSGGEDRATGVAVDASGNVVLVGYFLQSADFGGGVLASAGSWDVFVAKFNPMGAHVWSKRFGGTSQETCKDVAVDAAGNAVIVGAFSNIVDFGGGPLTSAGQQDMFVLKLDSAGGYLWSRRYGGTASDDVQSVAVGPTGIYFAGGFRQTVDFGAGVHSTSSEFDACLVKLDANGGTLWSRGWGQPNNTDLATAVALDSGDNALLAGYFTSSLAFGATPLITQGQDDCFLAKINSGGLHAWSRGYGGTGVQRCVDVGVGANGNIVVVADYDAPMTIGGITLPAPTTEYLGVASLTSAGLTRWAQGYAGAEPTTVVVGGPNGDACVAGTYNGKLDFGGIPLPTASQDPFAALFVP